MSEKRNSQLLITYNGKHNRFLKYVINVIIAPAFQGEGKNVQRLRPFSAVHEYSYCSFWFPCSSVNNVLHHSQICPLESVCCLASRLIGWSALMKRMEGKRVFVLFCFILSTRLKHYCLDVEPQNRTPWWLLSIPIPPNNQEYTSCSSSRLAILSLLYYSTYFFTLANNPSSTHTTPVKYVHYITIYSIYAMYSVGSLFCVKIRRFLCSPSSFAH